MSGFWSDDFDMDLLKLFPDLPGALRETAEYPLWTIGGTHNGKLNHPVVWNGYSTMESIFWLEPPVPHRDQHGWFTLADGKTANEEVITATWLEVLRDCWPHGYAIMLHHGRDFDVVTTLWDSFKLQDDFMTIMYDLRGWINRDVKGPLKHVKESVLTANERFKALLRRYQEGAKP